MRQLVYILLLLIITFCFTCSERKIYSTIKNSKKLTKAILVGWLSLLWLPVLLSGVSCNSLTQSLTFITASLPEVSPWGIPSWSRDHLNKSSDASVFSSSNILAFLGNLWRFELLDQPKTKAHKFKKFPLPLESYIFSAFYVEWDSFVTSCGLVIESLLINNSLPLNFRVEPEVWLKGLLLERIGRNSK